MDADRFAAFLAELVSAAERDGDVVGLVGFGSTADRRRVDEWSDHDFAWLVAPGAADRYRYDLGWLPEAERIALSVVEGHGGVKVVYDDGHVLEFGIDSVAGYAANWAGNCAEVLVDKGGVAEATATVLARSVAGRDDAERAIRLFVTQALIGAGRARRGEVLNGGRLVRTEAVGHLVDAVLARLPAARGFQPNELDPTRQVERGHPVLAARIEQACRLAPDACAMALLELAESTLADGWDAFPSAGVAAARRRLSSP
jgi:hypothetical protein